MRRRLPLSAAGMVGTAVLLVQPLAAPAAPPGLPGNNNPYPSSFYSFNPTYYGPYYPGQYQAGNVNPGVYNNTTFPRSSGYSRPVPLPYSASQYGSASLGSGVPGYAPGASPPGPAAREFVPPLQILPQARAMAVIAEVHVPTPDAELWVEGHKTKSTGAWRQFRSPPLAPGERYVYEFRVRWWQDGQPVSQTRKVIVHPGEPILVDFTARPAGANGLQPTSAAARR